MNKFIGLVAGVLVLVVGVFVYISQSAITADKSTADKSLGVAAGPEHTESQYFNGGATVGSGCFSTSTTGTLSAAALKNYSCIYIAPTGAGQGVISLTLPASTTVSDLLPLKGGCREWFIDNTDVAAATTTTVVAGTGHDLVGLDATGAGTGADVIDGLEAATIRMCRQSTGDVITFMQEYIHAD
jgi:hypothetical protein